MLALAEPVARAVADADVCGFYLMDLDGMRGADLPVRVQVHVGDWRAAQQVANRLGLTATSRAPSVVLYAGDRPQWGCVVEVFSGAPTTEEALDVGAAGPGAPGGAPCE